MWKLTFFALGILGLVALVVGPRRRQAIKKRLFLAAVTTLVISLLLRTGRYFLDQHRDHGDDDVAGDTGDAAPSPSTIPSPGPAPGPSAHP
jgi:hypothetical protein